MVRTEIKERIAKLHETPVVERINALREELTAAGDEAQELRHLPQWAANLMTDAGLYRIALPPELGGEDLTPMEQIEAIEAASAIDGSIGWCTQINSEINALVIRGLDPATAQEIYDDWGIVICCAAAPGPGSFYEPRQVEGGWIVSHRACFGSGCHNATWTWVTPPNDRMRERGPRFEPGPADMMTFLVPRGEFEIIDTWNTAGMRGTGSHDIQTTNVFVPDKLTGSYRAPMPPYQNTTYRNPTQVDYNKAAVALGVARGAIDAFIDLAANKSPWQSGTLLRDVPEVQYRLGEAIANLEAARAWLMMTQQELHEDLGPLPPVGNQLPSWEVLRKARLAAVHAAQTSRVVIDNIHNMSGTTGSRMDSPLERKLRDGHQAAAHGLVTYRHYRNLAMSYLGLEAPVNVSRGARDLPPPGQS